DPQVRLAALLALADLPPSAGAGRAAAALADPATAADRWLPEAATCAAAANGESFLLALAGQPRPTEKLRAVAAVVAEHYARGEPANAVTALVARLADADAGVADAVVRGLAVGWRGPPPRLDGRA